jgi:hypothetical protein
MLSPDALPQILWFSLSSTTLRPGDALSVIVLTSSNVASIELRIGGYGAGLSKTDVGHFEGTFSVPRLPFFVSGAMTMRIIARNAAGIATEDRVAIRIR